MSPGTWVTVFRYFGHRKEVPDALERDVAYGPEDAIHRRCAARYPLDSGTVRQLWHQPQDRPQMDRSLCKRGAGGPWRGIAPAVELSSQHARRVGRRDSRSSSTSPEL